WLCYTGVSFQALGYSILLYLITFFFQAEDGIRDLTVTGVQTCALPISWNDGFLLAAMTRMELSGPGFFSISSVTRRVMQMRVSRSEERRVGKECRSWWLANHLKQSEIYSYGVCAIVTD